MEVIDFHLLRHMGLHSDQAVEEILEQTKFPALYMECVQMSGYDRLGIWSVLEVDQYWQVA